MKNLNPRAYLLAAAVALTALALPLPAFARTVSTIFTSATTSAQIHVKSGDSFRYSLAQPMGAWVGQVVLEESDDGGLTWKSTLSTFETTTSSIHYVNRPNQGAANYRWNVKQYGSGQIHSRLEELDRTLSKFVNDQGTEILAVKENGLGIVASAGQRTRFATHMPSTLGAAAGVQVTPDVNTLYLAQVFVPANATLTGFAVLNGEIVGTNKYVVSLYDYNGNLIANSALDGTLSSGAYAYQSIPFTSAYSATGPAVYWVGLQVNGTTDRFIAIGPQGAASGLAGSVTSQTFSVVSDQTLPTTFTAHKGPIGHLY